MERTIEQLREQYEIEKELAGRLKNSPREERMHLYSSVYDELYQRVPHHPQLTRKQDPAKNLERLSKALKFIKLFLIKGATVAEVGPGDCLFSFEMCKKAKKVYGVDVSKEITKNKTAPENFQLVISDGISIPVPEGSINLIYSNQLMEHLHVEDAKEQLQNIVKALAPNGQYVCVTPNRINGPHDISKFFDKKATGFHLKEYTFTELKKLFLSVGFSSVSGYWGLKSLYFKVPNGIIYLAETIISIFPFKIRRLKIFKPFLTIRIVGKK